VRVLPWLWPAAVAAACVCALPWAVAHGGGDWRVFVAAGASAGTPALLAPPQDWQAFFYLPGAAYAFVPFARLPLALSFAANALAMLACAVAAGALAARTYGLPRRTALALYALWTPVVYSAAIIGQNAPFGLLLAQLTVAGMARRSVLLTALPVGALLYKPTYALPLIALLAVRGLRRELAVVAGCACVWYVLSAAATGGDWAWPAGWLRLCARFVAGDFAVNAPFALSLPGVLMHGGAPALVTVAAVAALAAACGRALRRAGPVEAASIASLAGLALSAHAWAYDAALALPALAWCAGTFAEPRRARMLFALGLIAPSFFVARELGFDPLALVTVGGTLAWLGYGWRTAPVREPLTAPA
jgi:Glycosyltransferase family 87